MTARTPLFLAAALALAASQPASAMVKPAPDAGPPRSATAPRIQLTPDTQRLVAWVQRTGDNRRQPYAVIDKRNARLYVFSADGRLRGGAPVLLGLAKGDDTVPGIGERKLADVKPFERTTPAGRFVTEHGENMRGEHVIWIDYDAAVSMHPVLTTNPKERRLQRLATPSVADNRVSYGCVNVPRAFFSNVVLKTLDSPHPVVYVLPETRSLAATFTGYDAAPPSRLVRTSSAAPVTHP